MDVGLDVVQYEFLESSGTVSSVIPLDSSIPIPNIRKDFGTKRIIDIFGSLTLLLILFPLLIGVALAVLANCDGGSVLFSQRRVGRGGRMFNCLKFRTMRIDAESALQTLLKENSDAKSEWIASGKLKSDPRVTPIGRFLRSTSLDELPQLLNVFVGDMSLVGPRPITQIELEGPYTMFGACLVYLSVRPGITGLWQVSGRSEVSYEKRVALDKYYVQNNSLVGDLAILFRTVAVVSSREGAF